MLIQSLRHKLKRLLRRRVDFGDLARTTPVSLEFGFDRGTPVDRHYIDHFLSANCEAIRGNVLEVGEDRYTTRFGADQVSRLDVLHVDRSHPGATIVGDLARASTLPAATFDAAVI